MKKAAILVLSLFLIVSLPGCQQPPDEETLPWLSPDEVSRQMYDALAEEWAYWNAQDSIAWITSSTMPGSCLKNFDDWSACEAFLGFSIPNPLETSELVEKGTYAGMTEGFSDAPRVQLSFYGQSADRLDYLRAQSGYRMGDLRIVVTASAFVDPGTRKEREAGWPYENEVKDHLSPNGLSGMYLTASEGEYYYSETAHVVEGDIYYRIQVIGDVDKAAEVGTALEKVTQTFFAE